MENVSENLVHVKENIDGQDPIAVEKLQIIVKEQFFFLFWGGGMEGFLSFNLTDGAVNVASILNCFTFISCTF